MNDKTKRIGIARGDSLKVAVETSFDAVVFEGALLKEENALSYTCSVHIFEMKDVKQLNVKTINVSALEQNRFDIDMPYLNFEQPSGTLRIDKCRGKVLLVIFREQGNYEPIARCYLLVAPDKLRINKLRFDGLRQDNTPKEKNFRCDETIPLVCSFNRNLLVDERIKTRLRLYYDCTTLNPDSGGKYEAFRDLQTEYKADSLWDVTFEERYAGAKMALSAFLNSPVNPNGTPDSETIRYVNLGSSKGVRKIKSVHWSAVEKIEFGKRTADRKEICLDEDGFLHIHTQGMFGYLVDVTLYEEDMFGTKQVSICQSKSVVIKDNCCYVPFRMRDVERYARRRRSALLEGGDFEIIAEVVPHEKNIASARSPLLLLNFTKEAKNPARSSVWGVMLGIFGKGVESEKKSQQRNCGGKYCITKDDFIPIVRLDKSYAENGFKYTNSNRKTPLSPYIEEKDYILETAEFDGKEEFVLRFEVKQGNRAAKDNKGHVHAIGRGVKITSQTEFTIKYGYKILLRISKDGIKSGAYIDFYANDNDWGYYSVANVHCGRINIGGASPTSFDKTITASEKELYINAILPKDRSCEGVMIIFDNSSIVYKCYTMGRGSNRNRLKAQGNGDTPTGKCSTQYSKRHVGNASYGNHGLIYLTGITGEFLQATKNGRDGIAIHAGHTVGYSKQITDKGCLMSTFGCLRVYNADIEQIIKIYNESLLSH